MFESLKTGFLAIILLSTAFIANAQKKIDQGTITYGLEYSLTPEQSAMAAMLPKEQKVKFNGNILRMDMEQGPATIGIIQDFVEKKGLMLLDVPIAQMQYAVKQSKEDLEKAEAAAPKLSDFKITEETQKIGSYTATKYTYKDDKGTDYELWTTNEIEFPTGFSGKQFENIKGALVKYTTFQNGIKVTLTIKNIDEGKVGPFSLEVPSGYELKTLEEIMAMQGGGQ